jgi:hypothetical protein
VRKNSFRNAAPGREEPMEHEHRNPGKRNKTAGTLVPAAIAYVAFLALLLMGYSGPLILYGLMTLIMALIMAAVEDRTPRARLQASIATGEEEGAPTTPINHGAVIGLTCLVVLGVVICSRYYISRPHRPVGFLTACESNLKNLGTALEMYSCDNGGAYPHSLAMVTPNYLKMLPTCPAAGTVTYCYMYTRKPDNYTMCCGGRWHNQAGLNPDFPRYSSTEGLRDRP